MTIFRLNHAQMKIKLQSAGLKNNNIKNSDPLIARHYAGYLHT